MLKSTTEGIQANESTPANEKQSHNTDNADNAVTDDESFELSETDLD